MSLLIKKHIVKVGGIVEVQSSKFATKWILAYLNFDLFFQYTLHKDKTCFNKDKKIRILLNGFGYVLKLT